MSDAILVLGAGGFIGRHLAERLAADGVDVIAATRRPATFTHPGIRSAVAACDDVAHFARWPSTVLDDGLRRTWLWFQALE